MKRPIVSALVLSAALAAACGLGPDRSPTAARVGQTARILDPDHPSQMAEVLDQMPAEERAAADLLAESILRETPPAVDPEPAPEPPPPVPGSADDPWGPILCAAARHPAHHRPCVEARATPAAGKVTTTTVDEPSPQSQTTRQGGPPGILERIAGCESGSGPNSFGSYTAQNPRSTASGRYQFLDSTFQGMDSAAGYSRAADAPPAVQEAAAAELYAEQGTTPWNASRYCWG